MSNDNKTHYRRVYKSNHLGIADLEDYIESGMQLIFTIKHVKQEQGVPVAGRKGDHNIAYFVENIKPWVINATNAKILKGFANSAFVEDWSGLLVQLYIDPSVRMKGEVVGGVRVMTQQPRLQKDELTPANSKAWSNAISAYKRDGNLNAVLKRKSISNENAQLIIAQAENA